MGVQLFANNVFGSLGGSGINATDLSIPLATGHGARFPTPSGGDWFLATLIGLDSNGNETSWEIVKCTANSSDILTAQRHQESTSAAIWPAGTRIEMRHTAASYPTLDTDTTLAANSDTRVASQKAMKAYADALVVGLLDDRGSFNASGNAWPTTGGSGSAGAIMKGDLWIISVAGTLGGHIVTAGDVIRALVDSPGSTDANWAITENNFGYVAENSTNKVTSISSGSTDTEYPSAKLLYDQLALKAALAGSASQDFSVRGLVVGGIAGAGFIELPLQSSDVAIPGSGNLRLYFSSLSGLRGRVNSGQTFELNFSGNTASRLYTFPDRTGTLADNTDLAGKAAKNGSSSENFAVNALTVAGSATVSGVLLNNSTARTPGTTGNLNIFTSDTAAINVGAVLSLGGKNGTGGAFDPWSFVNFLGAKENSTVGNLAGYLSISTPNSGGSFTEGFRLSSTGVATFPIGISHESIVAPTLLNSWVNYGGGQPNAGYWKDAFGVVHLEGLVKSGTPGSSSVIFTLPVGYRPVAESAFPSESNQAFGFTLVQGNGDVIAYVGSGTSFSLAGITFRTS